MASQPNVLPLFAEPDGNNSASAIADAIRKTKYHEGLTNTDLAFQLRCDASTIENAENKRNLLRFDTAARLLRRYPQHCAGIRQLWDLEPTAEDTPDDMIKRALDLIERAQQRRASEARLDRDIAERKLAEARA